jgi:hypothetical protein
MWRGIGLAWAAGACLAPPPTDGQIAAMARYAHPEAGVGLVVNGEFVFVDGDIRPKRGEVNHDERLVAARDLTPLLMRLALDILGPTHFIRSSDSPKFGLLYAPHTLADAITIDVGNNPIEIFGDPKSPRQVVIYGDHPDARVPYGWVGSAEPLTHGPDYLTRVTAAQLQAYHDAANAMAWAHGFMRLAPLRQPNRLATGRPSRSRSTATPGPIGAHVSTVLRAIGRQPARDPRETATKQLRQAGERYHTMSGCVGALIISGFSDQEIIDALEDAYQELFAADEVRAHMVAFHASPAGLRKTMSRGFAGSLLPASELDAQLNTASWTLYPAKNPRT